MIITHLFIRYFLFPSSCEVQHLEPRGQHAEVLRGRQRQQVLHLLREEEEEPGEGGQVGVRGPETKILATKSPIDGAQAGKTQV